MVVLLLMERSIIFRWCSILRGIGFRIICRRSFRAMEPRLQGRIRVIPVCIRIHGPGKILQDEFMLKLHAKVALILFIFYNYFLKNILYPYIPFRNNVQAGFFNRIYCIPARVAAGSFPEYRPQKLLTECN